jgi:hypothetical protein
MSSVNSFVELARLMKRGRVSEPLAVEIEGNRLMDWVWKNNDAIFRDEGGQEYLEDPYGYIDREDRKAGGRCKQEVERFVMTSDDEIYLVRMNFMRGDCHINTKEDFRKHIRQRIGDLRALKDRYNDARKIGNYLLHPFKTREKLKFMENDIYVLGKEIGFNLDLVGRFKSLEQEHKGSRA